MKTKLTVAIGDVHGELDKLKALLQACKEHLARADVQYIFLGDYIDRGPDSKGVIDLVREMNAITLVGNHETMLLEAIDGGNLLQYQWDHSYGKITTYSFGVETCLGIPVEYTTWMRSLPYFHNDSLRTFVHAGIQRWRPILESTQSKDYMTWARDEFMNDPSLEGGFVVHGHTPRPGCPPDLRENRLNLDTGACFGGLLSAAVFDGKKPGPTHFIQHTGQLVAF